MEDASQTVASSVSRSQLRRIRLGWYLFDFANSILIINGGLYFPQWIVLDNNVSDLWFNLTLIISTILLLLSAPALGLLSDRKWGRLPVLRLTSFSMFAATILIGFVALLIPDRTIRVGVALAAFTVILYGYQLSIAIYNTMLASLSGRSDWPGVSGLGFAAGWLGGIVGILTVFPFVQGLVPFFQPAGRVHAFLPSAILFGILTIVSLRLLKEDPLLELDRSPLALSRVYKETIRDIGSLLRRRSVFLFLIAYLLFSDAILTVQNNSTIYLEAVMGFSDEAKAYLFLLLLVVAAIGAVLSGMLPRFVGLRKSLLLILVGWAVVLTLGSFVSNASVFILLFGVIGLLFGAVWNVSRVLFLELIPLRRRGEYFGIYSSFERFGSLFGPLLWSLPVTLLPTLGPGRYRAALFTMGILIALSIIPLHRAEQVRES